MFDDLQRAWEGVARDALESTGCDDPPVDAFELAECLGYEVRSAASSGGHRRGQVIYVPLRVRPTRQHAICAHETGHGLLEEAGEQNTEAGARYLSGALLLPRAAFLRDLSETDWNVEALRARHVNASAELIARRIVNLCDAVCTIFDQGKVQRRVVSPWLPDRFQRLSAWERELADEALRTQRAVRGDHLVWAVPVTDGPFHRVVLVAEAEQLALRL